MSEYIKCACTHCGAKYRLPQEAQGRSARCKSCGKKFKIPVTKSLEDSVLDWLADPRGKDDLIGQPRIVTMPKRKDGDSSATGIRRAIRLKSQPEPDAEPAAAKKAAK